MWYERLIDYGYLPDFALRVFVRVGLNKFTNRASRLSAQELKELHGVFQRTCIDSPIAVHTMEANDQHYELPVGFFEKVLSSSMKYSGSLWGEEVEDLTEAEKATLRVYLKRASIENGQSVLDLGAGWGALSLEIARAHENSSVTSVTNSSLQKEYLEGKIVEENLKNIEVLKTDVNNLEPRFKYDRVVSIEMFEHLRNPAALISRISDWLSPDGKLFIQVFSHKNFPQHFDNRENSWMAKHFFTGGMMPYDGFYSELPSQLRLERTWVESGMDYHKTLECWLKKLDSNRSKIVEQLEETLSPQSSRIYMNRYRLFLIFCSELFRFNRGNDWHLMHYLFSK